MQPIISIIMGSKSDWETMKKAAQVLEDFGVVYEKGGLSSPNARPYVSIC